MADDKNQEQNLSEEELLAQWEDMASEEEEIAENEGAEASEGDSKEEAAAAADSTDAGVAAAGGENQIGEKILDQNEIDSLLGISPDDDEGAAVGVKALLSSGVVNYERLPMLDVIFDKFERLLSISLRHFTADNVDITVDDIKTVRFEEFVNSIQLPAGIVVSNAIGLDDYILMVYESRLIYGVVDVLLGGRKAKPVRIEGRSFTTIERRIMDSLSDIVLADLSEAFAYIAPIQFSAERMEVNPRFANITREGNACIMMTMRINLEEREGFIHFCLPYGTLEPIREQLLQQFMGEKMGQDNVWASHLERELYPTNITMQAVLSEEDIPLRDVLEWRLGETIMLDAVHGGDISLKAGGRLKLSGRLGKMADLKAIQISRHIADINNDEDA